MKIYVFINNHLSGIFQLSFLWGGPTELRIAIVAINAGMFFAPRAGLGLGGSPVTIYEALILFAGTIFTLIYVWRVAAGIRDLRGAVPAGFGAQSRSMKSSSAPK